MSPTQAGLAYLRAKRWTVTTATWWQSTAKPLNMLIGGQERVVRPMFPGIRKDLWGWMDAQAIVEGEDITDEGQSKYRLVGIQFCSLSDVATHEVKIRTCPTWPLWQATGAGTLIVGVGLRAKDGKRGARKVRTCVERWVV